MRLRFRKEPTCRARYTTNTGSSQWYGSGLYALKKERADDAFSRNNATVEMTREEDINSAMDVWSDYWIDAPVDEK